MNTYNYYINKILNAVRMMEGAESGIFSKSFPNDWHNHENLLKEFAQLRAIISECEPPMLRIILAIYEKNKGLPFERQLLKLLNLNTNSVKEEMRLYEINLGKYSEAGRVMCKHEVLASTVTGKDFAQRIQNYKRLCEARKEIYLQLEKVCPEIKTLAR
jgi:hypothetical protein